MAAKGAGVDETADSIEKKERGPLWIRNIKRTRIRKESGIQKMYGRRDL